MEVSVSKGKPPHMYFCSDHHFFHEKSIMYDKRPFKDVEEMNRELVKRHNAVVPKENSIVYFLGDVGFCNDQYKMKNIIDSMNGAVKVLVLGNHDKKMHYMLNVGFDVVCYSMSISIGGEVITMSHCPLKGVFREETSDMRRHRKGEDFYGALWHGELQDSKQKFTVANEGCYHLHGHCHKQIKKLGCVYTKQQFDVGVCGNDYKPYKAKELMSWVAKSKGGTLE